MPDWSGSSSLASYRFRFHEIYLYFLGSFSQTTTGLFKTWNPIYSQQLCGDCSFSFVNGTLATENRKRICFRIHSSYSYYNKRIVCAWRLVTARELRIRSPRWAWTVKQSIRFMYTETALYLVLSVANKLSHCSIGIQCIPYFTVLPYRYKHQIKILIYWFLRVLTSLGIFVVSCYTITTIS